MKCLIEHIKRPILQILNTVALIILHTVVVSHIIYTDIIKITVNIYDCIVIIVISVMCYRMKEV